MGILFPHVQVSSTPFSSEQPLCFGGSHPNVGTYQQPSTRGTERCQGTSALRSPGGFVFTSVPCRLCSLRGNLNAQAEEPTWLSTSHGHCSSSLRRAGSLLAARAPLAGSGPAAWHVLGCTSARPAERHRTAGRLRLICSCPARGFRSRIFLREMPNIFIFPFLSIHRTP